MDYRYLAKLMQSRTEVFNRIPQMIGFLNEQPEYELSLFEHKRSKSTLESSLESLRFMLPILKSLTTWQEAELHEAMIGSIKQAGLKNGKVLWPVRISISGLASTPGGAVEIAYLLGKEETISRMEKAIKRLEEKTA